MRARVIVAILLPALLAVPGAATAAPGEDGRGPKEIRGLRATPEIPVRSVGARRPMPDHPGPAPGSDCDKDVDLTSTIEGLTAVAAQDNGICTNADIDTYTSGAPFVVQAGGEEAAWTHTDVSDPASPSMVGQFVWRGGSGKNTYTPDVKAFPQGGRDYIALSLERLAPNGFCGVVIVDVTDPANPEIESQIYKNTSSDFWCDVHNSFVETVDGDGRYLYLTADARNDMRVIDIANVESLPNPCDIASGCNREIGRYRAPTAGSDNYVHDVTVLGHGTERRAYLSYWESGLVILDAADVTPGVDPTPIVGPGVIDPAGFLTHHAWASPDGSRVFIQDEFLDQAGDEPVQMWDVSDPSNPTYVDGIVLGTDVPASPAHNLEIRPDIDPDRLYVGWYKLGLQAWDFGAGGFVRAGSAPRTAVEYHQAQTEGSDGAYSGAWGVRLALITVGGTQNLYLFQSDRNFGLIVDCAGCEASAEEPPPGGEVAVTAVDPDTVAAGTTTPVTISGSGFEAGATVSIENGKGPNPEATVTGVSADGTEIYAEISVKPSGPSGSNDFDVRVTNPDGSSAVLPGGLTVVR